MVERGWSGFWICTALFFSWVKTNLPLPPPSTYVTPLQPLLLKWNQLQSTSTHYNYKISFSYNFNQYWYKTKSTSTYFNLLRLTSTYFIHLLTPILLLKQSSRYMSRSRLKLVEVGFFFRRWAEVGWNRLKLSGNGKLAFTHETNSPVWLYRVSPLSWRTWIFGRKFFYVKLLDDFAN